MKYWKPRAAAIVVLVAALLIGGVGGANQEGEGLRVSAPLIPGESTVATALNRLITTLAGVERAEDSFKYGQRQQHRQHHRIYRPPPR